MTARPPGKDRADALAASLELGLDAGVCLVCFFWEDGLAAPALKSVRRACVQGVPDAETALADLELRGGRSVVARSIVRRLAEELSDDVRRRSRLLLN